MPSLCSCSKAGILLLALASLFVASPERLDRLGTPGVAAHATKTAPQRRVYRSTECDQLRTATTPQRCVHSSTAYLLLHLLHCTRCVLSYQCQGCALCDGILHGVLCAKCHHHLVHRACLLGPQRHNSNTAADTRIWVGNKIRGSVPGAVRLVGTDASAAVVVFDSSAAVEVADVSCSRMRPPIFSSCSRWTRISLCCHNAKSRQASQNM